jgi:hypothetical protein
MGNTYDTYFLPDVSYDKASKSYKIMTPQFMDLFCAQFPLVQVLTVLNLPNIMLKFHTTAML